MKTEELYLKGQDDLKLNVTSARVGTYKLNKGERILLPKKCARLCVALGGEFSFALKLNHPEFKTIDKATVFLLFEENQEFEALSDNAEILVAEFDIIADTSERIAKSELHGIYAKFKGNDRKLLEVFIDEAPNLNENSQTLKFWLALLTAKLRNEYLRAYKSTLETKNGAIFFGTAPVGFKKFDFCVTDAFLIITDKQNGEKRAIKFSCENRFLERQKDCKCETGNFVDKPNLKFARLSVNENCFFKIWLFPENPNEKLNVSPFTHTLKFTFSIKSNSPCTIGAGISNLTDYEMVSCTVKNSEANVWNDCLLPLFGWDSEEKINGYIRKVIEYIDDNYKEKITVPTLAKTVHLHPNYLSRIFKEYMGCSISSHINNKRISVAKKMLAETDKTVESIAAATGFYDSHHLQKCFKLYTGITPTDYKSKL